METYREILPHVSLNQNIEFMIGKKKVNGKSATCTNWKTEGIEVKANGKTYVCVFERGKGWIALR